ncbi:MAG: hypothetical protein JWN70_4422 [Planctomycetaceae bacterium]|nr:hypothetical protein [Planctomycetaceae bacterium]
MGSVFQRFWNALWNSQPSGATASIPGLPQAGEASAQPERLGYPPSFPALPADERVERSQLFDPALQKYSRGFRLGEPTFLDPEIGHRWFAARRRVMDHLVQVIGESDWKNSLVLRGSYLLKHWLGDVAREPKDLDWVIRPVQPSWLSLSDWGVFKGLTALILQRRQLPGSEIRIESIVNDEIWAYDRVPGRRMVLTWQAEDLPLGTSQMDFSLNDQMWHAPVETTLTLPEGRSTTVWIASPELSLAWKLLWLGTDTYPQGKDLYDATLLAEHYKLPSDLVLLTMKAVIDGNGRWEFTEEHLDDWFFQWEDFKKDYPGIQGTEEEWLKRLLVAIKPAFVAL